MTLTFFLFSRIKISESKFYDGNWRSLNSPQFKGRQGKFEISILSDRHKSHDLIDSTILHEIGHLFFRELFKANAEQRLVEKLIFEEKNHSTFLDRLKIDLKKIR